jgi:hypothetical protein
MSGLGSAVSEWVAVKRLVTPFARWLQYGRRSGLGLSESHPSPLETIAAVDVAQELDTLLKNARIESPFIIVCHSWAASQLESSSI